MTEIEDRDNRNVYDPPICPDCDGRGYMVVEWSNENEHGQDTRKCDFCDGTGRVLV